MNYVPVNAVSVFLPASSAGRAEDALHLRDAFRHGRRSSSRRRALWTRHCAQGAGAGQVRITGFTHLNERTSRGAVSCCLSAKFDIVQFRASMGAANLARNLTFT